MKLGHFESTTRVLKRTWINKRGLDLSKEVLWVSVGQKAAELPAIKVWSLKNIVPLSPAWASQGRTGSSGRTFYLPPTLMAGCSTALELATQRILSLMSIFVNRNCEYFYQKSGQKVIRKKYFRTILFLRCYLYFLYSHPCRLEHAHFRFLSIELSTLDENFFIIANIFCNNLLYKTFSNKLLTHKVTI